MDFGLTLATHGLPTRIAGGDAVLHWMDAAEMSPVADSVEAERQGFHSVWLSDHVVTERVSEGVHTANTSGKRAYPDRPNLFDVPTTIAAIAAATTTLRFSPSVYIAPYRHPLITAHEFTTIDHLSNGRVTLTVGIGWELGEFAALGSSFEQRGSVTEECLQIYKAAWTQEWIEFAGEHFQISNVSMSPQPIQTPHIPLWYGGITPSAARRAARHCEGLYPMFLDAHGDPRKMDHLAEAVAKEGERIGRDLSTFQLAGFCQIRLCDDAEVAKRFPDGRPLLTGSAEQVIEDLELYARHGYSHITGHFDTPSGTAAEWKEQIAQFAEQVIPEAAQITARQRF